MPTRFAVIPGHVVTFALCCFGSIACGSSVSSSGTGSQAAGAGGNATGDLSTAGAAGATGGAAAAGASSAGVSGAGVSGAGVSGSAGSVAGASGSGGAPGGGAPASSGSAGIAAAPNLDPTIRLKALTTDQKATLCDWFDAEFGGYGVTHQCPAGGTAASVSNYSDQAQCLSIGLKYECDGATVAYLEACTVAQLPSFGCDTPSPACEPLYCITP